MVSWNLVFVLSHAKLKETNEGTDLFLSSTQHKLESVPKFLPPTEIKKLKSNKFANLIMLPAISYPLICS